MFRKQKLREVLISVFITSRYSEQRYCNGFLGKNKVNIRLQDSLKEKEMCEKNETFSDDHMQRYYHYIFRHPANKLQRNLDVPIFQILLVQVICSASLMPRYFVMIGSSFSFPRRAKSSSRISGNKNPLQPRNKYAMIDLGDSG